MHARIEKRLLQAAVAMAAIVPVGAGSLGVWKGSANEPPGFDSHFRYLSGLLLGLGLTFWSLIPGIDRRGGLVRTLTFIVVLGGLCRLYSLIVRGDPGTMHYALVMELIVTPALCLWQTRVSRRCASAEVDAAFVG